MFEDVVQVPLFVDEKPQCKVYIIREVKGGEYPIAYQTLEDGLHTGIRCQDLDYIDICNDVSHVMDYDGSFAKLS